jgi:formylglycine-generating enzyme required for sulfatase activity
MKNLMLSIFTLLLFAAATTTATAQEAKPKLAVLVVGMDDWMIGDVLAHLVGEELNRGKTYDVVTRRNDVQNKLEALRRGNDDMDGLFMWADDQGINTLCVVTTTSGLNFSLQLLDISSGEVHCSGSSVEPNAVALKQLAWSLTGSIGDSCTLSNFFGDYTEPLIEMEMVYVEGGAFKMGCKSGRDDLDGNTCRGAEKPLHDVTVGSFWIGKYEVTQAQWQAVMGTTIQQQRTLAGESSLYGVGPTFPMYYVSWNEAKAFCDTLSARTGKSYRLATEEEWEYAARGGKWNGNCVYSGGDDKSNVMWYNSNSSSAAHRVGQKRGNELGIYDMSGNVWEWCMNKWRSNYGVVESGSYRVIRGGSWPSPTEDCRIASRLNEPPGDRLNVFGFRVV